MQIFHKIISIGRGFLGILRHEGMASSRLHVTMSQMRGREFLVAMTLLMGGHISFGAEDLSKLTNQAIEDLVRREISRPSTLDRFQALWRVRLDLLNAVSNAASGVEVSLIVSETWERNIHGFSSIWSGKEETEREMVGVWKRGGVGKKIELELDQMRIGETLFQAKDAEEFHRKITGRLTSEIGPKLAKNVTSGNFSQYKQSMFSRFIDSYEELNREMIRRTSAAAIEATRQETLTKQREQLFEWIGLRIEEKTHDGVKKYVMTNIARKSPAEDALVNVGDRVIGIEKKKLSTGSGEEVFQRLDEFADGAIVKVSVRRNEKDQILRLTLPVRPWKGGPLHPEAFEKKAREITMMALASLDQAVERFKMDFNTYPKSEDWRELCQALASQGKSPEEFLLFQKLAGNFSLTRSQFEGGYNGPYLKVDEDGLRRDGWSKGMRFRLDPTGKIYQLYSFGPNGKDEGGKGDDIDSDGSQSGK